MIVLYNAVNWSAHQGIVVTHTPNFCIADQFFESYSMLDQCPTVNVLKLLSI